MSSVTVMSCVYVPTAVKVSTRSVAKPLAAVEVSRVIPVPAEVMVKTFAPTPKTVLSRSDAGLRCVVISVVAVDVSNLADGLTVIVKVCVDVSPIPSVAVSICA